jgi:hypothetical protein
MSITVRVVTRFGARYIYPACDKAKLFCLIANTKTMTSNMLALIQELGYEIVALGPETPPQQTAFTPSEQPGWWRQQ